MVDNTDNPAVELSVIGKGIDVEKMQKRLKCAARATGINLHLSWQHECPQTLSIGAKHPAIVTCDDKLVLDGLRPTEEIETLLIQLKTKR